MTTQIRAHVNISGRVQGVGFRASTRYQARGLNVTGWVRNRINGQVEAVFEGDEAQVKAMVAWCQHGNAPARVSDVQVKYLPATGEFNDFRITY